MTRRDVSDIFKNSIRNSCVVKNSYTHKEHAVYICLWTRKFSDNKDKHKINKKRSIPDVVQEDVVFQFRVTEGRFSFY